MRTLLVDHERDPARVVQDALSDCGFAVDVACTLDEAAAAFLAPAMTFSCSSWFYRMETAWIG